MLSQWTLKIDMSTRIATNSMDNVIAITTFVIKVNFLNSWTSRFIIESWSFELHWCKNTSNKKDQSKKLIISEVIHSLPSISIAFWKIHHIWQYADDTFSYKMA